MIKICNTIADMAVPIFFFLSALLFFRDFGMEKYKDKVIKRFKTLIVPYFIWSILCFLFYFFLSYTGLGQSMLGADALTKTFFELLKAIVFSEYNNPLWFIRVLFAYVILSPIFLMIFNAGNIVALLAVTISVVINLMFNVSYSSLVFWLPIYILGGFIGNKFFDVFTRWEANRIIFIITCAAYIILLFAGMVFGGNVYYLLRCFSPVFCWIVIGGFFNYGGNYWWENILSSFSVRTQLLLEW